MRRRIVILAAAFVVAALLAGAVGALAWVQAYLSRPQGDAGIGAIELVIPQGATARDVARVLERQGVVAPAWLFSRVLQLSGVGRRVQAGEYRFHPPVAPREVLEALSTGQDLTWPVTVPEGLDIAETARLLASEGLADEGELLAAFRDPEPISDLDPEATSLEGYLFPETYRFPRRFPASRVAETMVRMFRSEFLVPYERALDESSFNVRQVVALASLVEKETGLAEERPRIAGVFLERLSRGMRLQCDPTVIYALKLEGRWDGNIRRRDLSWDHPYNTYTRRGLPPGPIASPGGDALIAVLEPDRRGELFFVARGDGSHAFSKTLSEHERAVRRYQLRRR